MQSRPSFSTIYLKISAILCTRQGKLLLLASLLTLAMVVVTYLITSSLTPSFIMDNNPWPGPLHFFY